MKKLKKALTVLAAVVLTITATWFVGCDDKTGEIEDNTEPSFTYEYGFDETVTPYWLNEENGYTLIYNEIVVPIQYGSKATTATGYLTYEPYKIISVRDYTLEKEYGECDYALSGNAITVATDGSMPYIRDEWLDYKNIPEEFSDGVSEAASLYNDNGGTNRGKHVISEGSLTRTNHLCVTYAYKSSEQELGFETPEYAEASFARLTAKMKKGEPIKMLVFGDSISVGASASSFVNFAPYLPTWFDLVKSAIAKRCYGGDESRISLVNTSVGGENSNWGVRQIESGAFDVEGYDFVIVGFGMNDSYSGYDTTPAVFAKNIEKIVSGIREGSPDADFLVMGPFTPNPKSIFAGKHADYVGPTREKCEELDGKTSGCVYISMYEMTTAILSAKQKNNDEDTRYQYIDLSSNYTNHPNDFTVRLYAGAIIGTVLGF